MEWEALLSRLYRDFILRDITAKIVPGVILLLGVAVATTDHSPHEIINALGATHGVFIALIIVLGWPLGFAVQTAREITEWVGSYLHFWQHADWPQIVSDRASFSIYHQQHIERLVVIKEATGNLAYASAFFGLSLLYAGRWNDSHWGPWLFLTLVLFARSLYGRRVELKYHYHALGQLTGPRLQSSPGDIPLVR